MMADETTRPDMFVTYYIAGFKSTVNHEDVIGIDGVVIDAMASQGYKVFARWTDNLKLTRTIQFKHESME